MSNLNIFTLGFGGDGASTIAELGFGGSAVAGGHGGGAGGTRDIIRYAAQEQMNQESARRQRQQAASILQNARLRREQLELLDNMHRQRQTNVAIIATIFSEL